MINLEIDHEIINTATTWESEGEKLALAIVVKTWGSSPRQPGSMMLIREDGHIIGSVSGGCVEGACSGKLHKTPRIVRTSVVWTRNDAEIDFRTV